MRSHDWSSTPLGAPEAWPQSLRSMVSMCLNSPMLGAVLWGPDLVMLYNDGYIPSLADRHPGALGRPVAEVWGATWEQVSRPFDRALRTGEGFALASVELSILRLGRQETTYWDFTAAPIRGEDGSIVGLLNQGVEITERVRAEQRIASELEQQRRVLQQMPGFVGVLEGPDHIFRYVNDAYVAIAGRHDFIGRSVRAVFPELAGQGFYELLDQVYLTGAPFTAQHMPIRLASEESDRFIDLLYYPVRDAEGSVSGIFVGGYDTTAKLSAQSAVKAERDRLASVLGGMAEGFSLLDRNFTILDMNAEAVRMSSLPREAIVGHSLWAVHPGTEGSDLGHLYRRAMEDGVPVELEHHFVWGDGRSAWLHMRAYPVPEGLAIFFRDVTVRRAAEAERDKSSLLLRIFAEAVPGVVYAKDHAGRIMVGNRGTTELIGKPPEVYIGKTDMEFLEDKQQAAVVMATDQRIMTSGQPEQVEELVDYPDGSRGVWLSHKAPLRNGAGEVIGLIGSSVDITDRKRAEAALSELNETLEHRVDAAVAELRQTEEALRQSQKMEAVGQLTGGIAHDFNNLLQGITGSLNMLEKRLAQGRLSDLNRFIGGAMGAANRAAALTHRLLAFSRRQPLDPKAVRPNPLVVSMEDLLRRTLGEHIELDLILAPDLWLTLCDPHQLENAVLNLAINGRDAMPDGGRLTIETGNCDLDETGSLWTRDMQPGAYVCISVTDTGTGMTQATIDRAFEPFFTTKPIGQGTGLGLSMIYGFVRQSEGYTKIESELGHGTSLKLLLPRYGADLAQDEPAEHDLPKRVEADGKTVLVIEDEPMVRALIVEVVADLGYLALEAADGAAGLDLLRLHQRVDLLITDIGLPGLNGRQVADTARLVRPALKVILITGYAEDAASAQGFLEPGMAMIAKPFAMEALAAKIGTIIDDG